MAWHLAFLSWVAHAAISAFLLLAAGCLAARLCRQPVRRLRLIELTLLACLLAPWLPWVPALPHYRLGWFQTSPVPPRQSPPVADQAASPVLAHSPSSAASIEKSRHERSVDAVRSEPRQPADSEPAPTVEPAPQASSPALSAPLLVVLAYLGLMSLFVLRWLAGVVKLRRVCKSMEPAPPEMAKLLEHIAGPDGRRVRLLVSDQLELPIMFGWRRPVILLPAALCRSGDVAALRFCLAHEWSHVEQRDILRWHLATVTQFLFFYQPLFWWLRWQLRLCQDYLADARAAEQATVAEDYADYLVGLARRRLGIPAVAALGIGDRRTNLYRRILMLLTTRQPLERKCRSRWTATAALATVFLLVAVAAVRLDAGPSADDKKEPPQNAPSKTAPGKPIPYTGRVFDKATNKGIEGAVVTVRRSIYGDHIGNKIVQETRHKTNAEGKYSFVVPPEQAAERYLYIELDVEAPGYAPRKHFGYSFAMIQKNEKMGGRPFFENVDLRAAKEITGVVETPEGNPAAGIKVLAYSNTDKREGFEYGSFADCKTDAKGRFHLWLVTPGPAVFWLLPNKFAPSTHVLQDNKRGDLGRFTLQPGLILRGKVLDTQGRPAAGVYVEAGKRGGIENFNLPVADHIRRTALTNDKGEFTMDPLPPGKYEVVPQEHGWDPSKDASRPTKRPLPGVFVRKTLTLKEGEQPESLEIRAVPHIVIEAQYYNSKGQTTRGHAGHLFGRMDKNFWFGQCKIDGNGKMTILAPHGLTEARLSLSTNEHGVLRHRLKKGEPLRASREINLGTLDDDVKGIEIIHYVAPILIVDARDKDGQQIKDFKVQVTYKPGVGKKRPGERFVNGVQGDVFMEKQEDGRWRTEQMLPEEEVAVTVSAKGYKSHTEKLKLTEGTSRDLAPVLEKE